MSEALGAFVLMHRANALVTVQLAQQYGCGVTDMRALVFIAGGGDTTPGSIGRELGLSSGATTTLVDRLESADWAHRVPNPHDRRSSYLELRPGGRAVLEEITAIYAAAFTAATDGAASPASFDGLTSAFTSVGAALRATVDRGSR
ncbi:MarR family winged helix-turn-helix transcriptional regulator [Curtobacterium sp. Leaf261]|uniref:MarR family winged helix-turn-helix transcriptional regulator n=1 Tax=Curtobacterium sp. Leaf261 TaxID=1736311 RepID=UPI0012E0E135|nr:MarR family winged helix-turn-helix transcriptional regulator [Curtobacterium sp. Leaf261]